MKLISLIFLILFAFCERNYAQCGKNIRLTGSKTIHLDENGNINRTDDEKSLVQITPTLITITVTGEIRGVCTIKSTECEWSVPFKKGRTLLKATITNDDGEVKNVSLSIEGTDEGIFILFEMEGNPGDRVKVVVDKFEEA